MCIIHGGVVAPSVKHVYRFDVRFNNVDGDREIKGRRFMHTVVCYFDCEEARIVYASMVT